MIRIIWVLFPLLYLSACASKTYTYEADPRGGDSALAVQPIKPIIVGEPSKVLDASDWIWPGSLLGKLVLWNKNIDSHQISQETIDKLAQYISENKLEDVQVLVNTYKPGVQWNRLFRNREVGAGWRFTLGIFATSMYTILPGRFFGGDHYNPYTNTISIYSDDAAIALHEAGHAKDFNSRKHKGAHAAVYSIIPGAPLYYEAVASSDALSYLDDQCRLEEEKHAYRALHPAYGTYVGGLFLRQSGVGFLGAIPGHITGAIAALNVDDSCGPSDDENQTQ